MIKWAHYKSISTVWTWYRRTAKVSRGPWDFCNEFFKFLNIIFPFHQSMKVNGHFSQKYWAQKIDGFRNWKYLVLTSKIGSLIKYKNQNIRSTKSYFCSSFHRWDCFRAIFIKYTVFPMHTLQKYMVLIGP